MTKFQIENNKENYLVQLLKNKNQLIKEKYFKNNYTTKINQYKKEILIHRKQEKQQNYPIVLQKLFDQQNDRLKCQQMNERVEDDHSKLGDREQLKTSLKEQKIENDDIVVDEKDHEGLNHRICRKKSEAEARQKRIKSIGEVPYIPYNLETLIRKVQIRQQNYQ